MFYQDITQFIHDEKSLIEFVVTQEKMELDYLIEIFLNIFEA